MSVEKKDFVRLFIKTVLLLEFFNLFFTTQIAMAQDINAPAMVVNPKPALSSTWESARDGALIGFGSGAAVSMIGYAANVEGMDVVRIMSGTTGAGFLFGAVYGFVEAKFFNDSLADNNDVTTKISPQIYAQDHKTGYGLFASIRF